MDILVISIENVFTLFSKNRERIRRTRFPMMREARRISREQLWSLCPLLEPSAPESVLE